MVICHHSLISVPTSFTSWDSVSKANMCMWWVLKKPSNPMKSTNLHVHTHTHIFANSQIYSQSFDPDSSSVYCLQLYYYSNHTFQLYSSAESGGDNHRCMGAFPIHCYSIFQHIQMSVLTKWISTWDWLWFMLITFLGGIFSTTPVSRRFIVRSQC